MKIVQKKASELIKADYNPRKISKKDRVNLSHSLDKFGVVEPIIVNVNPDRLNVVVGGHQRLDILISKGIEDVPCVEVNLDLEMEKELNLRLNRNKGEFDYKALLSHFSVDSLTDVGFELDELGSLLGDDKIEKEDDFEIEDMEAKLYEHHDYLIITFDNYQDFLLAVNIFGIRKVNHSASEKVKKIGLGRVLRSDVFYSKLKDYVEKSNNK